MVEHRSTISTSAAEDLRTSIIEDFIELKLQSSLHQEMLASVEDGLLVTNNVSPTKLRLRRFAMQDSPASPTLDIDRGIPPPPPSSQPQKPLVDYNETDDEEDMGIDLSIGKDLEKSVRKGVPDDEDDMDVHLLEEKDLEKTVKKRVPTAKVDPIPVKRHKSGNTVWYNPSEKFPVYFAKMNENGIIPTYASLGSAGMDLYLPEDVTILPEQTQRIDLQVAVQMPSHLYGRIATRSGIGCLHPSVVISGVIDSDYRNSIEYVFYSLSKEPYTLPRGTRIAQMILERYCKPKKIIEIEMLDTNTSRGTKGLGQCSGIY